MSLAAIRKMFDYLLIGQVIPVNPAASVRGPRHVVKKGKTPVLSADEARQLIDSIDVRSVSGLRDRALMGAMVFSFARVSAILGMNVEHYFAQRRRMWFRLREKGGKDHFRAEVFASFQETPTQVKSRRWRPPQQIHASLNLRRFVQPTQI